jgi:hypothetical protein
MSACFLIYRKGNGILAAFGHLESVSVQQPPFASIISTFDLGLDELSGKGELEDVEPSF